jgi:hypothetical protein
VSLNRLIFYSAMIGGWAAFVGWLLSEIFLLQRSRDAGILVIGITTAMIGAFIAGGLTLLGGVASGTLRGQWQRFIPGLVGGFLAGALGGLVGNLMYLVFSNVIVRILGWTVMGLSIGAVEGLYDRSPKKIRNGLIGGAMGGFLGGLLFEPVAGLVGGVMSSRAAAFVILGMCIGCFVGLAQVILKEAWLTVESGFRPGRQLVLSMPEIIMGTSEKAALPFIAFGAKGVEPVHLRITRRNDGSFLLQDNHSRTGTFVNGRQVQGEVVLRNEDAIQLGVNVVRFREVLKHVSEGADQGKATPAPGVKPAQATPKMVQRPPEAIAVGLPPQPRVGSSPGSPPARPKPPSLPSGGSGASPIAAGPPKASPPPGGSPRPPVRPAPPSPGVPNPPAGTASAAVAQNCPICGRAGVAVAQSHKRRCASCGILF